MKKHIILFVIIISKLFSNTIQAKNENTLPLQLWYKEPAKKWEEALPVGNGRLGAMIYAGIEKEKIQFNEETLWTGQPHDYARKDAYKVLDTLRSILANNKQDEAHKLANRKFMSTPMGQQAYQAFGDLIIDFPTHHDATNYKRTLSLDDAIVTTSYEIEDVRYMREIIASEPDQAIIIHLSTSKKGALNFNLGLSCPHRTKEVKVDANRIVLSGKADDYKGKTNYPKSKITFEAILLVENKDGKLESNENKITIANATGVTVKLVAATNFVNYKDISADPHIRCVNYLANIINKDFSKSKKEHIEDYQRL